MTSKELSKLIREFVRREIEFQKEEIIKEVKAELFDAIVSGPKSVPNVNAETANYISENVGSMEELDDADVIRNQLRSKFSQQLGLDTVSFNTENTPIHTNKLPDTFNGGPIGENHAEVIQAMNKNYSTLMKKMGIGKNG